LYTRYLSAALTIAALLFSVQARAQETTTSASSAAAPQAVALSAAQQQITAGVPGAVKRFGVGLFGGVGVSPILIEVGANGTFGPIFTEKLAFRPGIELGWGEVTTNFGFNLDLIYLLGDEQPGKWRMYAGGGANFALSHEAFQTEVTDEDTDTTSRFDFSDTDFETGLNIIFGASRGHVFTEVHATAWGAHNVRLLAGYRF